MKNVIGLLVLSFFIIGAVTINHSTSVKEKNITIYNNTDLQITKIFLAVEGFNSWKELKFNANDLLEKGKVTVKFAVSDECFYDVKVINSDDQEYFWYGFDLCQENEIYLEFEEFENEEEMPDTTDFL